MAVRLLGVLLAAALPTLGLTSSMRPPPELFSSYELVTFRLEAPLAELFETAKGVPDYAVEGRLVHTARSGEGKALPVSVALRGHTSRRDAECTFPKLKVDLRNSDSGDTIFRGIKTLKIGTHCGESPDNTLTRRFGRLPNERAPFREAAVYRMLAALGVPALHARPARVSYVFTDTAREPLVRNAMLLEDDDDAIARIGGTREIEAQAFTSADLLFATTDAADVAFAEALIGNFDWCLKFTPGDTYRCDARMKLWNIIAAATPDGRAVPLLYDFDVAGMVAGSHRWFQNVFNAAFSEKKSQREVEVIAQLQRTRSLFPRGELDAVRRRFTAKKGDVLRALEQSDVDAEGRRVMREYIDAFYREIESDERFYRPVVAVSDVRPRADADPAAAPVCAARGPVPVGTPVGHPLETRGEMIRVVMLDALWHWAPPATCPPVQSGTVWIASRAISRDFPKR